MPIIIRNIITLFYIFHLFEEFEGFISDIPQVGEDMGVAIHIETRGIIEQHTPVLRILNEVFGIELQRDIIFVGGQNDFERIRFFKSDTNMSNTVYFIVVFFDCINKTSGDFFRVAFKNLFMIGQNNKIAFDAINLHTDIPGFIQ